MTPWGAAGGSRRRRGSSCLGHSCRGCRLLVQHRLHTRAHVFACQCALLHLQQGLSALHASADAGCWYSTACTCARMCVCMPVCAAMPTPETLVALHAALPQLADCQTRTLRLSLASPCTHF